MLLVDDIQKRFDYVASNKERVIKHELLRKQFKELALVVHDICPENSREKEFAITKLEEALFWANASVARHQ